MKNNLKYKDIGGNAIEFNLGNGRYMITDKKTANLYINYTLIIHGK